MEKKPYERPEIKEVKLSIEDTLLAACRQASGARVNPKRSTTCRSCRTTYRSS